MIDFEAGYEKKLYEKTNFLEMDYGTHQVRLVGEPKVTFVHYFPKGSVQCLGRECPICRNNKQIELEHPDNPRQVKGYNKPNKRHFINVLDRSMVKVCPSCGTENKRTLAGVYNPTCKKCNKFITEVPDTRSDKVKVANLSETVKEQLRTYQNTILDAEQNPVGLENFDIVFLVTPSGDKKNISALPTQPLVTDKIEDVSEFLYDLDSVTIKLEPDELAAFMSGVTLKDIFAARREAKGDDEVSSEVNKSLLEDLFNK